MNEAIYMVFQKKRIHMCEYLKIYYIYVQMTIKYYNHFVYEVNVVVTNPRPNDDIIIFEDMIQNVTFLHRAFHTLWLEWVHPL